MAEQLRQSGIENLGDIEWGSHFCQFYETIQDMLELLVPFFKVGLENNEFCLWVIAKPLTKEECIKALQRQIPGIEKQLQQGHMEILKHDEWYLDKGRFNPAKVIKAWGTKLEHVLANGFDGMRVNGNEAWLKFKDWKDFMDYERELNHILSGRKMIVLCTYELANVDATVILDVAHVHECAITKRKGQLIILEVPEIKQLKARLKKMNEELAQKVAERTGELSDANAELTKMAADLRKLSNHLQIIREEERKHIAREIHDELGQFLTAMKFDIAWLHKKQAATDEAIGERLKALDVQLDAMIQSVRKISAELRPSLLDEIGLEAAMEWHLNEFKKRTAIAYSFEENGHYLQLPDPAKTVLFRIFQESLTNIARHSHAKHIQVRLTLEKGGIGMTVKDNGKGFDPRILNTTKSLGILGMKERAAEMNGLVTISTLPGRGTTISVWLPLT
ncbi:MEDS domain-containing protein [Flavisolibacter nicotianae]|uniref:MEDS domain-containing protein n=1 Tax=Flavisolibacter nicotianae TaxID=2364882 RepID=UPI000EAD5C00|nr:MEDS domain-containing protein [Flavisolibacter nicotianae]